jgi:hypothetical protein
LGGADGHSRRSSLEYGRLASAPVARQRRTTPSLVTVEHGRRRAILKRVCSGKARSSGVVARPPGGDPMVSAGGGGGGLPNVDSPIEIAIVLVVLVVVAWLAFKFYGD